MFCIEYGGGYMLITFGFFTPVTAGILLVVALVIFGPGKLPEIGKSLGKGIKEFKDATENGTRTDEIVEAKTINLDKKPE